MNANGNGNFNGIGTGKLLLQKQEISIADLGAVTGGGLSKIIRKSIGKSVAAITGSRTGSHKVETGTATIGPSKVPNSTE